MKKFGDITKEITLSFINEQISKLSKLHGGQPTEKEKEKIEKLIELYEIIENTGED